MEHSMYEAEPLSCQLSVKWLEGTLSCTLGANTFSHIVYRLYLIACRVLDFRYGQFLKTECAVANLTVKMYVPVIISVTLGVAQLVANAFTAVFNLMQEMVLLEKGERTEYA